MTAIEDFARDCASWRDHYLLEQHALGAAAYQDQRYFRVIEDEVARRGLATSQTQDEVEPPHQLPPYLGIAAAAVGGFILGALCTLAAGSALSYVFYLIKGGRDGGLDELVFYVTMLAAPFGGIAGTALLVARAKGRLDTRPAARELP